MSGCVFCSVVDGSAPPHEPLAETEGALAFMNASPAALGHALVIPKRHADDIWDLPREDGAEVWTLTHRVALAARDAFGPEGLNLFQANGRAGWQSVFHFHIHVVPRWAGDPLVPNWVDPPGDPAEIVAAGDRLRAALAD